MVFTILIGMNETVLRLQKKKTYKTRNDVSLK